MSRRTLEQTFFWVILTYFAVKTFYFAFRIRDKVFPDETTWFGISDVFSRSFILPTDSPESFSLGLITHIPYLYFFLMGKVLALNYFHIDDLLLLRGINALFGILSVYFSWRLCQLLSLSLATSIIFVVLLTNTSMYSFISGAVNYDNLCNLLAVLSLYYLVFFLRERKVHKLLLFISFLLLGTLTKNVFLPYALALTLVLIFYEKKNMGQLLRVSQIFKDFSLQEWSLSLCCLLLFLLNLSLYGGNKLYYGQLIPDMGKVLPVEDCLKNRLFARNYGANQVKAGRMTVLDAQRVALQVRDPGDRAFAWSMIDKAIKEKGAAEKIRMGRLQYTVEWGRYIFSRTYGVAAHLIMNKSDKQLYPYYAIFALSLFLFILKLKRGGAPLIFPLIFISSFYIIVLMQFVNYKIYLESGFVGLALTGRYIFPVLVPIYIIVAYGLMDKMPRWWQWSVGLAVSGIFIWGDFPWFLRNATPAWYF